MNFYIIRNGVIGSCCGHYTVRPTNELRAERGYCRYGLGTFTVRYELHYFSFYPAGTAGAVGYKVINSLKLAERVPAYAAQNGISRVDFSTRIEIFHHRRTRPSTIYNAVTFLPQINAVQRKIDRFAR